MRLMDLEHGLTTVLGFEREGRALEQAVLQHVASARVEVVCDRAPGVPPRSWPLRIGQPDERIYESARVLRSPGVPVDHPVLHECRRRGISVTGISSLWFGERPEARVIGVTGSKGKSTTAALIAHLLDGAGLDAQLAGNIGLPLIGCLESNPDWFVVELSSYQLVDLRGRVSIGAITRLFPEHADWHGSVDDYYAAKLRLAALTEGRPLWINGGDDVLVEALSGHAGVRLANTATGFHAESDGLWHHGRKLLDAAASPLPGRHNLDNMALALSVVDSVCGRAADLIGHLKTFTGLPHRLQTVAGSGRTAWINDSISTTPYATRAALESLSRLPVLIAGGLERQAQWTPVVEACRGRRLPGLVVLPDNGSRIAETLIHAGCVSPERVCAVDDVEQAVHAAAGLVSSDGCVLLSPGAPSFPRYRDFEERGERFVKAVRALEGR